MALHKIGCVLVASGIVLLIVWATKNLSATKLKKTSIVLIIIGIAIMLLTKGCGKFGHGFRGYEKHQQVMIEALQSHGVDMTEEEIKTMMEEMKGEMMGKWKK